MLRKASRRVSHLYDTALESTGLKTTQFTMLAAINRAGNATMGDLAEILVMDRSTLGHNLRPLERDKLLKIEVEKHDARTRRVRLTLKGERLLAKARAIWQGVQARFEATFGDRETKQLRAALLALATLTI
jgi:DNA-binding MarR family transcriptional regulator